MNTKHTPGPWRIGNPCAVEVFAINPNGGNAADTLLLRVMGEYRTPDEARANARLIAAAPELLAALIECEALLARIYNANGLKPQEWVRTPKGERAAKAIAKATGQQ